ncbi:MAG: hypothetical protein R3E90_08040 [Marinicella sp.]|nr:hypothetical protein [Xanthomonadales bacterium]
MKKIKNITLTLIFWSCYIPAQNNRSADDSEQLMDNLIIMSQLVSELFGQPENHELVEDLLSQMKDSDQNLPIVFNDTVLNQQLNQRISAIIDRITQLPPSSKLVEFPQATPLTSCVHIEPVSVEIALVSKAVADEVKAYAEWECKQLVAGENSALACFGPEVVANAIATTYEYGEFCLKNRAESNIEANLETTRSIGEHLNEYLDETISSRVTQESVDAAQDTIDDTNQQLTEYIPDTNSKLETVLDELDQVNGELNNVQSQAESLLFRTQINQVEIEEIELTASDVQQRTEEIRDDTQSLIINLQATRQELISMIQHTQVTMNVALHTKIEFTLSRNPLMAPILYQLPSSRGGLLEQVREILVHKLILLGQLGYNINAAEKAMEVGDNEYNSARYQSAYQAYSDAYKQLINSNKK